MLERNRRAREWSQAVAMLLLLAVAAVVYPYLLEADLAGICALALVAIALVLVLVYRSRRSVWSSSFSYLAVFCIFHFGLAVPVVLGLSLAPELEEATKPWFHGSITVAAYVSALLGLLACAVGSALPVPRLFARRAQADPEALAGLLEGVGAFLTMVSIASWLAIVVAAGGPGLLFGGYAEFLAVTARGPLPLAYFGLGLGVGLLAAGARGRWWRAALAALALWGLVAFPLGLRGELLFPVVTYLVVSARTGREMPLLRTILAVFCVLVATAAVREVRRYGLRDADLRSVALSPVDAVAELGASLRPVVEVRSWVEAGEPWLRGASYWAPFDRGIRRLLPFLEAPPPAELDDRLLNVVFVRDVGPIGSSPVAEAYLNWSNTGVVLVMFCFGLVVAALDAAPRTPFAGALAAVVLVPLLNHVRNSFVPVPAQVGVGAVVLLACSFASSALPARARAARAGAPWPGTERVMVRRPTVVRRTTHATTSDPTRRAEPGTGART